MSSSEPPIRVVQCPKCGSPVQGVSAGDIATCNYCGATLQVSAGASGHPVARLANIEASTSYLARTEALKRLRDQLDAGDRLLLPLKARRFQKDQEVHHLNEQLMTADVALDKLRAKHRAKRYQLERTSGCVNQLFRHKRRRRLRSEIAELLEEGQAARAERDILAQQIADLHSDCDRLAAEVASLQPQRDRLAQRIAQLEAGLDDLADQL
jgi:chromosome segregation ATPase